MGTRPVFADGLLVAQPGGRLGNLPAGPWVGVAFAALVTGASVYTGALAEVSSVALLGVGMAAWLAVENGGNDVSKGVAPLVSASVTSETGAVLYGALVTLVGSLASFFFAPGLFTLFTVGLMTPGLMVSAEMALAIAGGASLWVALATRWSLPVSTTHALVGAVLAVGGSAYGVTGVLWASALDKLLIPLLVSPVAGLALAWSATALIRRVPAHASHAGAGAWLTSGAICLVRAMNDTPKIAAIAALAGLASARQASMPHDALAPFVLVAVAMAAGSLLKGFPVTRLLAHRVTSLGAAGGLGAPLASAGLIFLSSGWALPVSTTHVSTCAIVGAGLCDGQRAIHWSVVRDIAFAWLVTLPAAGLLAVAFYLSLLAGTSGAMLAWRPEIVRAAW